MFNRITVVGHLGRDVEKRTTPNGADVATLNVACSIWKAQEEFETVWFDANAWGKMATYAAFGTKGDLVVVSGELSMRKWLNRENEPQVTPSIRCDSVKILTKKGEGKKDIDPDTAIESQVTDEDNLEVPF